MDYPYANYTKVKFSSPTKKQIDRADKEARKLAVREKIAEEKAERERVDAENKAKADKQRHPEYYSDSDSDGDIGLKQYQRIIRPHEKIDEYFKAEPIGPRLFDDKLSPVYPSYIGKDGKVRADDSDVAPPSWLSIKEQSGANRSKRRRKSNRRVATRKSKRGRVSKSKRVRTGKSKRTMS
jgi:hypothetical protein